LAGVKPFGADMGLLEGANYLAGFALEQWKSPEELAGLQEERLKKALEDASGAGFYREMLVQSDLRFNDAFSLLESLPTTTKEQIQANPGAFTPEGNGGSAEISRETTGSTGKPLTVRMDRKASTMRTALMLLNSMSCGLTPLSLTANLRFSDGVKRPPSGRMYGVLPWIALDILDDEMKNLEIMRARKADSLGYYPSAMAILAKANMEGERPLRLKRVLSGAEMLTPAWRKLLEDSFRCPVFNKYGSWEFGPIAWECPEEHSLHVNTGTFHMEILDGKNRPLHQGIGRVVMTSLCNRAMPLIRYEQGDLAGWGAQCPCGRGLPVIKSLEGRADDMVVLPSGKLRSPLSMRFTDLECVVNGIRTYQLIQEREGLFLFRYVPSPAGFSESSRKDIERRISIACLGEPVSVEFEEADEIKRNRRGKLDRLISKVSRRRSILDGGEPS
jgi:phenylacetate-CoA ligase